jgi:hypothetical protein
MPRERFIQPNEPTRYPAMEVISTIGVLLAAVPSICSSGDLIRCGSGLVSTEISATELLNRCGEPSSRAVSTQDLRDEYGVKVGTLTTESWRYDGDTKAPRMTVTIVDGQIQSIERGK